jgi:hypothetical protein
VRACFRRRLRKSEENMLIRLLVSSPLAADDCDEVLDDFDSGSMAVNANRSNVRMDEGVK